MARFVLAKKIGPQLFLSRCNTPCTSKTRSLIRKWSSRRILEIRMRFPLVWKVLLRELREACEPNRFRAFDRNFQLLDNSNLMRREILNKRSQRNFIFSRPFDHRRVHLVTQTQMGRFWIHIGVEILANLPRTEKFDANLYVRHEILVRGFGFRRCNCSVGCSNTSQIFVLSL